MLTKRIPLFAGSALFFLFTFLQLNDAAQYGNFDAWAWVLIYGVAAGLSAAAAIKPLKDYYLSAWAGFSLGALFFRLQDNQGNFHFDRLNPANFWGPEHAQMVQDANESGGLFILFLWSLALFFLNKKK